MWGCLFSVLIVGLSQSCLSKTIHLTHEKEQSLKEFVFSSESRDLGKKSSRLLPGEWRIETTIFLEENEEEGAYHNHTFKTKQPAKALSILMNRQVVPCFVF
jgi:hypothetical protein